MTNELFYDSIISIQKLIDNAVDDPNSSSMGLLLILNTIHKSVFKTLSKNNMNGKLSQCEFAVLVGEICVLIGNQTIKDVSKIIIKEENSIH